MQLLRYVANAGRCFLIAGVQIEELAAVFYLTQNSLQQRSFTGSVGTDQRRQFTAMDVQVDITQDGGGSSCDIQMFDAGATQPTGVDVTGQSSSPISVQFLKLAGCFP